MALHITCPECGASFSLADTMAGKTIRCGKCKETFPVKAASSRRRREEEPEEEDEKPKRSKASTAVRRDEPERRASAGTKNPRPAAARKKAADNDEEEDPPVRKSGSPLPWIIGGVVACVFIMTAGAVAVVVVTRDKASPGNNNTAYVQPPGPTPPIPPPTPERPDNGKQPDPPIIPVKPPEPEPKQPPEDKGPKRPPDDKPPSRKGELTREARDKVKKATVYLRVTMPDKSVASGTGFFGDAAAPNIILTNAHVVGMLSSESRKPLNIEVFINSGQSDERKLGARVLGVDRSSDLAVLDVGGADNLPAALTVKPAKDISELDNVFVFGFPFGESLGKEITIRPSSVSSLRKKGGILDRIQVNGGMDPGNSGGPVVDDSGHVIGVAVSGIPGRMINFAIPGEYVHVILNGRISALGTGQAFFTAENKLGVPLTMEMIDPRNRIKEVGLEVWTGNAPTGGATARPPASSAPPTQIGDSPRQRVALTYLGGMGKGDMVLPEVPPGKVVWIQPVWVHGNGNTNWAAAHVYRPPAEPVYRTPATLSCRFPPGINRQVKLTATNSLRVSGEEDSEVARITSNIVLREVLHKTTSTTGIFRLFYQSVDHDLVVAGIRQERVPDSIKQGLKSIIGEVEINTQGKLVQNAIVKNDKLGTKPSEAVLAYHDIVKDSYEALAVPLPGRQVAAMESWKGTRLVTIDTPGGGQKVEMDLTITYLGQRKRNGKDEAVLAMNGVVRDRVLGGTITGTAQVDLSTGTTVLANATLTTYLPIMVRLEGKLQKIKVISALTVRLERGA